MRVVYQDVDISLLADIIYEKKHNGQLIDSFARKYYELKAEEVLKMCKGMSMTQIIKLVNILVN
jgi:hypothetical protein